MLRTLLLAALFAGPGSFDYNRSAPLDIREAGVERRGAVTVRDISFASAAGGRTSAYLVSPPNPRKAAPILFVHWYDSDASNSNRTQYLDEAVELAGKGAVSLLIETMWSDTRWFMTRNPAQDYPNSVQQVRELRRALDVLLSRPGVDPARAAYVGHDFGAMYGAVMASADRRVKAWALAAGTTSFSDWYLLGVKLAGEEREKVVEQLAPLDPLRHIAAAAPAPVLFQFARSDRYVPVPKAEAFFAAAAQPKEILWYDAGHELNRQASADRIAWLSRRLSLRGAAR